MYDPTVICTYMDDDVFLETDEVTDAEKDFIRNCIYRQELLNAFSLDEYDDEAINKTVAELFPITQSIGLPICATEYGAYKAARAYSICWQRIELRTGPWQQTVHQCARH